MAGYRPPSDDEVSLEDFGSDGRDYSEYFQTDVVFDSVNAATNWAKGVAVSHGFEVIIASHKNDGRSRLLICARGARYRGAERDRDEVKPRKSKTKSCGCMFRITVRRVGDDEWAIEPCPGIEGQHNHKMATYPEGYRQMSGLSPGSKKIVKDMTAAQAKPSSILAAVKEKYPMDHAHPRQVYNYRDTLRQESYEGRADIVEQFFHLAVKYNYIHEEQVDPETQALTHIFMAHPLAVALLRTYPYFFGLDSTYKTNRYRMPLLEIVGMTPANKNFLVGYVIMKDETESSYRWALQQLRSLFDDDALPTAICTDRELGLMNPLRECFPNTPKLLCTWHINKDVEHQVYKLGGKDKDFARIFKNGKWKKIVLAQTEAEYDAHVANMRVTMSSWPQIVKYIETTWLVHKEKFVKAWTNDVLHMGNTTTCRVESAHHQTKEWLNTSTGALDTVWSKVHLNIEHQLTEIRYS